MSREAWMIFCVIIAELIGMLVLQPFRLRHAIRLFFIGALLGLLFAWITMGAQ